MRRRRLSQHDGQTPVLLFIIGILLLILLAYEGQQASEELHNWPTMEEPP